MEQKVQKAEKKRVEYEEDGAMNENQYCSKRQPPDP